MKATPFLTIAVASAAVALPSLAWTARENAQARAATTAVARGRVCMADFLPVSVQFVDQSHVRAGHEGLDVHEDEHAIADRADAGDEARVDRRGHLGRGLDCLG